MCVFFFKMTRKGRDEIQNGRINLIKTSSLRFWKDGPATELCRNLLSGLNSSALHSLQCCPFTLKSSGVHFSTDLV